MRVITTLNAAAILALASCAADPLTNQKRTAAMPCCTNETAIDSLAIQGGKPIEVKVDKSLSAYKFDTGVSYAVSVLLPSGTAAKRALIKTNPFGLFVSTQETFCPSALFLDSDSKEVGKLLGPPLAYKREMGWASDGYYFVVLDIPVTANRMVIFSNALTIGKPLLYSSSPGGYAFFNGKSYTYVSTGSQQFSVPCAESGEIEIEVR